jgi:hypothetical protein
MCSKDWTTSAAEDLEGHIAHPASWRARLLAEYDCPVRSGSCKPRRNIFNRQ